MCEPIVKVTQETNFCRIFRLPPDYPEEFCFGGGRDTIFAMVDWFNPIPQGDLTNGDLKFWNIYKEELVDFLRGKQYVWPDTKYLFISDFNKTFIFNKDGLC